MGTVTVERNGTGMRPGTEPRPSGLPSEAERRLTVERLDRSWIGRAADVLALSFADGPETSYILGGTPRRRQRVFRSLFRGLMWGYWRVGEAHGAILDGRLVGVGLRFRPGRWPVKGLKRAPGQACTFLGALPMLLAFPTTLRLFALWTGQEERHPDSPPAAVPD